MVIEIISYYKKTVFSSWLKLPPYNLAITDCL